MLRSVKALIAVAALALAGTTLAAEIKEINFGVIATEKAGGVKQMWELLLRRHEQGHRG